MNWSRGLKRLSAVITSCGALLLSFIAISERGSSMVALAGFVLLILLAGLVVHKTFCWILDGFIQK